MSCRDVFVLLSLSALMAGCSQMSGGEEVGNLQAQAVRKRVTCKFTYPAGVQSDCEALPAYDTWQELDAACATEFAWEKAKQRGKCEDSGRPLVCEARTHFRDVARTWNACVDYCYCGAFPPVRRMAPSDEADGDGDGSDIDAAAPDAPIAPAPTEPTPAPMTQPVPVTPSVTTTTTVLSEGAPAVTTTTLLP